MPDSAYNAAQQRADSGISGFGLGWRYRLPGELPC